MNQVITVGGISRTLRAQRYGYANEIELHAGVEKVLTGMGLTVHREVWLGGGHTDRIDMTVELPRPGGAPLNVGIEVKVKGQGDAVRRQVMTYARYPDLDALILVTTMYRHLVEVAAYARTCVADSNAAGATRLLEGKPFQVALLNRGMM